MNREDDDDDEPGEEIIFDRNDSNQKKNSLLILCTCLNLGMITGLFSSTWPFLAKNISVSMSTLFWLIPMKAAGCLIGSLFSSYLYYWFNQCFLLGSSCLSISFALCLYPFMIDIQSCYLTSFVLGFSLALCYQGIDGFSRVRSIRIHHSSMAWGSLFVLLLLFPIITDEPLIRTRRDLCLNNHSNCSNTTTTTTKIHHSKPSLAVSDIDNIPMNFFATKMNEFFHSITRMHLIYFLIALGFVLCAIIYFIIAIRSDEDSSSSDAYNFHQYPHWIIHSLPTDCSSSLFTDRSTLVIVVLFLVVYLMLSGFIHSLNSLIYLLNRQSNYSIRSSLFFQCCYFFGQASDCFFIRWKFLSKKMSLLLRLILLFLLSFLNLLQTNLVPFLFVPFGYFLQSISRLFLQWINRDFQWNQSFFHLLYIVHLFSDFVFPRIFFSHLKSFLSIDATIISSSLLILYLIIIGTSQRWQINRFYRLLPTELELNAQQQSES